MTYSALLFTVALDVEAEQTLTLTTVEKKMEINQSHYTGGPPCPVSTWMYGRICRTKLNQYINTL